MEMKMNNLQLETWENFLKKLPQYKKNEELKKIIEEIKSIKETIIKRKKK